MHLVQAPRKSRLAAGPCQLHLQNSRFSLTAGCPPALLHTWDLVDLRRYGAVEGGRFCFEGGTRCGRGEVGEVHEKIVANCSLWQGLHVFRVDNAEDIQILFDLASKGRLENKKRAQSSTGFAGKLCRVICRHSPIFHNFPKHFLPFVLRYASLGCTDLDRD